MKKPFFIRSLFLLLFSVLLFSCASKKEYVHFQNIDQVLAGTTSETFETKLQPDDLLMIVVMAESPEAALPFNQPSVIMQSNTEFENQQLRMNSYLIDSKGNIQFPILGNLKLGGLTRTEAVNKIVTDLKKYIKEPKVNLRILNFKVSISGEVAQPATHSIQSERVTLIEALAMSGDISPYGKRDNIMIIREKDGKKEIARVDITKADFINSPYYYLAQNDHIYVEPNKTKINSSRVGPNTSVIITAISLLISVLAITIR